MKNHDLYPLKFEPILKEKIWGGTKLKTLLNKKIEGSTVGESWEISDVEGDSSVVGTGIHKGKTLRELIHIYQDKLVGSHVFEEFGDHFPLLIKFIDAKKNLSVQLHPDDFLAKKRHDSFGKTEMWYVMQADKDAGIILDFKEKVTKEIYLDHLHKQTLPELLNFEKVKKGDVFFIEPGLIHAIGGGVLLAEIQQTSDITYRVYDWERKDLDGTKRELHTALALDAIDFSKTKDFHIAYEAKENTRTSLVENSYFSTNLLSVEGEVDLTYAKTDSFVIYMCVKGNVEVTTEKYSNRLKQGETLLVPACFEEITLTGKGDLLEVSR